MGTADKVCAAALAIDEQSRRSGRSLRDVSLLLLELGGAFTAALAGAGGPIVGGAGGAASALGFRASGALGGGGPLLPWPASQSLPFRAGAAAVAARAIE